MINQLIKETVNLIGLEESQTWLKYLKNINGYPSTTGINGAWWRMSGWVLQLQLFGGVAQNMWRFDHILYEY